MQNFRTADSIIQGLCQTPDCDPVLLGVVLHGAARVSNCIHCSTVRSKATGWPFEWPERASGSPNLCISNVQLEERTDHFVFSFLSLCVCFADVCVFTCVLQM